MTLWQAPPPGLPEGYHRGLEPHLMAPFVDDLFDALPPSGRCLDVACGTGLVARRLPPGAIGIDAWDEMITYARSLDPTRTWLCADLERLPFRDATFDAVYCSQGLQFAEDASVAIAEAHRVGRSFVGIVWRDLLRSPGFAALHRALLAHTGHSPIADTHLALDGKQVRRVVTFPSARAFLVAYVEGSSLVDTVPSLPAATQQALLDALERELGRAAVSFPVEATVVTSA